MSLTPAVDGTEWFSCVLSKRVRYHTAFGKSRLFRIQFRFLPVVYFVDQLRGGFLRIISRKVGRYVRYSRATMSIRIYPATRKSPPHLRGQNRSSSQRRWSFRLFLAPLRLLWDASLAYLDLITALSMSVVTRDQNWASQLLISTLNL